MRLDLKRLHEHILPKNRPYVQRASQPTGDQIQVGNHSTLEGSTLRLLLFQLFNLVRLLEHLGQRQVGVIEEHAIGTGGLQFRN